MVLLVDLRHYKAIMASLAFARRRFYIALYKNYGLAVKSYVTYMTLQSSTFTDNWKIARITLIFKNDDPADVSNYISIAILPKLAKIPESSPSWLLLSRVLCR